MERFDETWEYDPEFGAELDEAFGPPLDAGSDPEEFYLSLLPDEDRCRLWPESVWEFPTHEPASGTGPLLFTEPHAEAELGREIRLSELWGRCEGGSFPMTEFLELATLVTEVGGVPGSVCADCVMLHRPTTPDNWALGTTDLCRAHLRFRLGHAKIDRST